MKPPSRGWSLGVPINGFQKSVMSLKRINENDTLRNRNRTKVKINLPTVMVMEMVTELTVVVLLVMFVVQWLARLPIDLMIVGLFPAVAKEE